MRFELCFNAICAYLMISRDTVTAYSLFKTADIQHALINLAIKYKSLLLFGEVLYCLFLSVNLSLLIGFGE